jgi:hypothetical protein
MQLNSNNQKIVYDGEDIVNVLKEINFILCSLHDIGSCYADRIDEQQYQYEKETTDFIDNSRICERLAHIRSKLTEGFDLTLGDDDMDDLERACRNINYWSKPGDSSNEFWV